MPVKEIGIILLVLVITVIAGNLWFHFVESILDRIKALFTRREGNGVWHTLPPEQEDENDV